MKIAVFTTLFLSFMIAKANVVDQMTLDGFYFGKNLVVINPLIGDHFAVESVEVNGNKTNDEIQSSVFEIDFSALGIEQGQKVRVSIKYIVGEHKPLVFNPEALEPSSNFAFVTAIIDRKSEKLEWTITGSPGNEVFEVEQFRWEKWVRIGSTNPKDSLFLNTYSTNVTPHFGKNLFRIKLVDTKGNIVYSPSVRLNSKATEIFMEKTTVDNEIVFSASTMYQVYDEKGIKWFSGTETSIDISTLAPGRYWVNYDNKTEEVKKK